MVAAGLVCVPALARAQTQVISCKDLVSSTVGNATAQTVILAGATANEGSGAGEAAAQAIAIAVGQGTQILYVPTIPCTAIQQVVSRVAGPIPAELVGPSSIQTCWLANGVVPDGALSDIAPATCTANLGTPPLSPQGQVDITGPVQATALVVPGKSTEMAISADAAYVVFGFGGSTPVAPWTDPKAIFVPSKTSGPFNVLSTAIGLAPGSWAPTITLAPGAPLSLLALLEAKASVAEMAADAAATSAPIGIVPVADAESLGADVTVLAYQHTGQSCGYLPNSDAAHRDRINVRQGRYALWTPLHAVFSVDITGAFLDGTGAPNESVALVASVLQALGPAPRVASEVDASTLDAQSMTEADAGDSAPPPALDLQSAVRVAALAGLTPWCAMQVTRAADLGPEASFQAPEPCTCYYESVLGEPLGLCTACRSNADCAGPTPTCRFGYCEVQ
jgi:hypothetical protein